jgi:hypothetical protein
VGNLGLAQQEDHGHDDRSQAEDAAVALHDLRAVRQHDHDAVAGLDAEAPERMRDPAGSAHLVDVGEATALESERFVFAEPLNALVAESRQCQGFLSHSA